LLFSLTKRWDPCIFNLIINIFVTLCISSANGKMDFNPWFVDQRSKTIGLNNRSNIFFSFMQCWQYHVGHYKNWVTTVTGNWRCKNQLNCWTVQHWCKPVGVILTLHINSKYVHTLVTQSSLFSFTSGFLPTGCQDWEGVLLCRLFCFVFVLKSLLFQFFLK